MTGEAAIGVDRPSIFGPLRYVPLSLIAPRRATRELLNEPRVQLFSWTLIVVFSLFSALVSTVYEWYAATTRFSDALYLQLNIDVSALSLIILCLVLSVVSLFAFLLARFLWKQLFLFFEYDKQVMAALGMSAAIGILLHPVLEGASVLLGEGDRQEFGIKDLLFGVYLVAVTAYGATYFSEALSIGWLRAIFTELAVFLIILICIYIPMGITIYILNPEFFTDVAPDNWTEVNTQIRQWTTHEQV